MEVNCPYSNKCSDYNKLCSSCKHNEKRSYYEPVPHQPYYPYYPYWPLYPEIVPLQPYPYWTTTTTTDTLSYYL